MQGWKKAVDFCIIYSCKPLKLLEITTTSVIKSAHFPIFADKSTHFCLFFSLLYESLPSAVSPPTCPVGPGIACAVAKNGSQTPPKLHPHSVPAADSRKKLRSRRTGACSQGEGPPQGHLQRAGERGQTRRAGLVWQAPPSVVSVPAPDSGEGVRLLCRDLCHHHTTDGGPRLLRQRRRQFRFR